jgi:hypothetical protein
MEGTQRQEYCKWCITVSVDVCDQMGLTQLPWTLKCIVSGHSVTTTYKMQVIKLWNTLQDKKHGSCFSIKSNNSLKHKIQLNDWRRFSFSKAQKQSASLNERESLTELRVICLSVGKQGATIGNGRQSQFTSHVVSTRYVGIGIKMGDHKRLRWWGPGSWILA